jgi:hypothetical protein
MCELGSEVQCKYIMQMSYMRSKMTRNLAVTFQEVCDELTRTPNASIPVHGDGTSQFHSQKHTFLTCWNADWVKVPIVETIFFFNFWNQFYTADKPKAKHSLDTSTN